MTQSNFSKMVAAENGKIRAEQAQKIGHAAIIAGAEFTVLGEDRYRLSYPAIGITFEVDRVRRQFSQLVGELEVQCTLPGARTVNGSLCTADLNLSSLKERQSRASWLASRANASGVDWVALVEEFCQRVLRADRAGQPAIDLRTVTSSGTGREIQIDGLYLQWSHPNIIFGDGGTLKSYIALYVAGKLALDGKRVLLADWELTAEDHKDRLQRLFLTRTPQVLYARCERPLVYEVDRIRRIVQESRVEFAFFDSVAFACDGPPESAEAAGRYFRCVRQLGIGSFHVAHVSKAENADQKPFGSIFWHNGARTTWYAQLASVDTNSDTLNIGLFNRKANLGKLRPPAGFSVTFTEDRTTIRRSDVAGNPDLAAKMSTRQRMAYLLKRGPMSPEAIGEEIDGDPETIKRTARRYKDQFVQIPDGRFALLERRTS